MKISKTVIFILSILFLNVLLFSQPKIKIINPDIDFGRKKYTLEVLHSKVFITNQGTDTLKIAQIKPGCGCTIASISNKNIAPGDTSKVEINLTISNFTGDIKKDITVISNDPKTPSSFIFLKTFVERALEIAPKWLAFNRVVVGEPATTELTITNHSNLDAIVKEVRFARSNIICDLIQGDIIPKGSSRKVKFTAIATEKGSLQSKFNIDLYHPEESTLEVLVYGNAIEQTGQK